MENILINLYHIGDTGPGGGIVFYRSAKGFTDTYSGKTYHYLEAAPIDVGTLPWVSSVYDDSFISGTGIAIGTGRKNTDAIIKYVSDDLGTPSSDCPAAYACIQYASGGKNDWFLPSIDELNELYKQRNIFGNFQFDLYWSSSEDSNTIAYAYHFNTGNYSHIIKIQPYYVRPIRSF